MRPTSQREQAETFRRLHREGGILVLPNAWDVITARVIESAGFAAIATSSAGVAWALGYADGERISRGEMLAVVRRIGSSVRVPVTADVEAGYGTTPEAAAETARGVIAAGAVGPNPPDRTNRGRLVEGPLNVIAGPPAPTIPELERLGVKRASLGPRLVQAALGLVRRAATELRERGTYDTFSELLIPFTEVQRLVAPTP